MDDDPTEAQYLQNFEAVYGQDSEGGYQEGIFPDLMPMSHAIRQCLAENMHDECGNAHQIVFAHDRLFGIQPLNPKQNIVKHDRRVVCSAFSCILGWLNPRVCMAVDTGLLAIPGRGQSPVDCVDEHFVYGQSTNWVLTKQCSEIYQAMIGAKHFIDSEFGAFWLLRPHVYAAAVLHESILNNREYSAVRKVAAKYLKFGLERDHEGLHKNVATGSQYAIRTAQSNQLAAQRRSNLRLIKGGAA